MTVTVGGSSGIVLPDATTIPSAAVTTYLSPGATNTANTLVLQPGTEVNGTAGLRVNNTLVTTANVYLSANTVAPVITGNTRDTQVLTCSTGTWTNSPSSYSYQWIRGTSTNVGTNANTYTCVTADIGYTIKCTVTATNAIGPTSVTSSPTATITANTVTASYLMVAGGAGGAGNGGGGGGAGGLLTGTATLMPGTTYTATIGGGGAGYTAGSNSLFTGLTTVIGGGAGGQGGGPAYSGGSGGSGGGGGGGYFDQPQGAGGAGTSGQGNAGGWGARYWDGVNAGGGGGGAGSGGGGGGGYTPGAGGSGAASSITGTSTYYAGGGGGGTGVSDTIPGGAGGAGGGGNGGGRGAWGSAGAANTGGGAGGGGAGGTSSGNGGSGVIILSVPTSGYSGTTTGSPTITTSGSNTIIKFTSSGTYTA